MNNPVANQSTSRVISMGHHLGAVCLLFLLTLLAVLVAHLGYNLWIIAVAIFVLILQGLLVAFYFTQGRHNSRFFSLASSPSLLFLAFFILLITSDVIPRSDTYRAVGVKTEAEIAAEIPFEITHGYGPIKEVIEVGPLDTTIAMAGMKIFDTKCGTCHKLDERYTGPPLRNVTRYRSPTFIMNQILDPAQNVAKHPHMQEMLKIYYTYMTNQNVTMDGARAIVEYLRWESERAGAQQ